MDEKVKKTLEELLIFALEDTISDEQIKQLNSLLKNHPERIRFMIRFLQISSNIKQSKKFAGMSKSWLSMDSHDSFDGFLKLMAEHEKTADKVEVPKKEPEHELVYKPVYSQSTRRINKFSLYTAIISTAALIFFILFVKFAPRPLGFEVATLTDSIDTKWADNNTQLKKGSRILTSYTPLLLEKGLVELLFDNNAKVVIEGPAEFRMLTEDQINLRYGRIYATVPLEAIGFTINTPKSRIIDLGTEFGIKADMFGDVYLHVIKGKTTLIAGSKSNRINLEVREGQAKKVTGTTLNVSDIPCETKLFVRDINSDNRCIWKGQMKLDLADMVGGGNGFGTGRISNSIDPVTGQMAPWKIMDHQDRTGIKGFIPVGGSKFIDGVFVPDGGEGPIQVTSFGNQWNGPDTSNFFKYSIINSLRIPLNLDEFRDYSGDTPKEDMILAKASEKNTLLRPLGLMGSNTSPKLSDSSIFIHANLGITFDLNRIRGLLSNVRIARFKSTFGIGEITYESANLDLWILVDGENRFCRQNVDAATQMNVNLELNDGDRFLSLVVTDGKDQAYSYDWGLFMNPRLEME